MAQALLRLNTHGEMMMGSRVLVVDDEFLIRWALVKTLSAEGYDAREAEDGAVALDLMAREEFDFIVLDLRMPGVDGWAVLAQAGQMQPDARVIVMTAHGGPETEAAVREKGAFGYVDKPEILERIRELLRAGCADSINERGSTSKFQKEGR